MNPMLHSEKCEQSRQTAIQKIVFLDHSNEQRKLRRPDFPHEWVEFDHTTEDQVVDRLKGATIAIVNRTPLNERHLSNVPTLKLIAVRATGYQSVDIDAARRLGITVSNVRGWCSAAVAEHVFALILSLRRHLPEASELVKSGSWTRSSTAIMKYDFPIDLAGSTLGIVGYGTLGKRVHELAKAFGMQVLIAERKNSAHVRDGRTAFAEVISKSDVLSLHCPLSEESADLIGKSELSLMRPHALLINCARGGLIDEEALADCLRRGTIGGAGLDVLRTEPPVNGGALLELNLPNLIVTPHQAWLSTGSLKELDEQLIANIESFVGGEPINVVT